MRDNDMELATVRISAGLDVFNKEAARLRAEAAKALDWTPLSLKGVPEASHFDLYGDVLPLPSGLRGLQFNDAVTEHALTKHVLTRSDPIEITFLAAKVVEQSFYQFFDPSRRDKPIKNLSV